MQHEVVLIGPTGREQAAVLNLSLRGVVLATGPQVPLFRDTSKPYLPILTYTTQESNSFPFEVIKKWLPSNSRSKNPAPGDDCLDLQAGEPLRAWGNSFLGLRSQR